MAMLGRIGAPAWELEAAKRTIAAVVPGTEVKTA